MKDQDDPARISAAPSTNLDWKTFCVTHFPGRRARHDLEALVAYGAYRRRGTLPNVQLAAFDEGTAGDASLAVWEDEGGGWAQDEAQVA